ncbi:hypothetical protein CYMTET_17826 [Cymbomonas tetramitiformis]|uniref:Uncharacterized protein n=1 Tax=Cymbomonas tetramitiformis TaxID=36881 RepID=A0AAE0G955_9CHLO|nr:hypothetical protein CYMTET_17826 [Cymbomonas tetramitiformis]
MEFKMNDKFERAIQPGKGIESKDKVTEKKKPGHQVAIFLPTSKVAKTAHDSSGAQVKDISSSVEAASRATADPDASATAHGEAENAPIVYRDHSPADVGPAERVNSGEDESRSVQGEREADTSERSGEEGFTTVAADAYCTGSWGVHRRQLDDASSAEQVLALKLATPSAPFSAARGPRLPSLLTWLPDGSYESALPCLGAEAYRTVCYVIGHRVERFTAVLMTLR